MVANIFLFFFMLLLFLAEIIMQHFLRYPVSLSFFYFNVFIFIFFLVDLGVAKADHFL